MLLGILNGFAQTDVKQFTKTDVYDKKMGDTEISKYHLFIFVLENASKYNRFELSYINQQGEPIKTYEFTITQYNNSYVIVSNQFAYSTEIVDNKASISIKELPEFTKIVSFQLYSNEGSVSNRLIYQFQ